MAAQKQIRFIELKAGADGDSTFRGRLSAYNQVDSYNDTIVPGAYKRTIAANNGSVVLLYQHKQDAPIGRVNLVDQEDGLWVEGTIVTENNPTAAMTATLLKRGVIKGMSIGFAPIQKEMKDDGVRVLKEIKLYEASIVTTPADEHAMVTDIKALGDGTSDFSEELAERQLASSGYCLVDILCSSLMQAWWNAGYDDDGDLAEDMPQILAYAEGVINDFKEAFLKALAAYGAQATDSDDAKAKAILETAKLAMIERKAAGKTKRVDGEDLPSSAFLIVGDPADTSTWKLPVKFSTDDKTKSHVRNALARIDQVQGVSSSELAAAKKKLLSIAKRLGIDAGKAADPIDIKAGKKISAETAQSMQTAHAHVNAAMESMKSAGMVLQSLYDGSPAGDGTDPDGPDTVKSGDPGAVPDPLVDLLKEFKEVFVA